MPLAPGTRLWHHDVTALLDEGQVWQATDTQLNREVAMIFRDAFAHDLDRPEGSYPRALETSSAA